MLKKLRTLLTATSFAALGLFGFSQKTAAQTVPIDGQTQTTNYNDNAGQGVSQEAVEEVAGRGVETVLYGAGVGFSRGIAQTGENIGLEFALNGDGTATVTNAYNMNNRAARKQFQRDLRDARAIDREAAYDNGYSSSYSSYAIVPLLLPEIRFYGWNYCSGYYNHDYGHYNRRYNEPRYGHHYNEPRYGHHYNEPRHENRPAERHVYRPEPQRETHAPVRVFNSRSVPRSNGGYNRSPSDNNHSAPVRHINTPRSSGGYHGGNSSVRRSGGGGHRR